MEGCAHRQPARAITRPGPLLTRTGWMPVAPGMDPERGRQQVFPGSPTSGGAGIEGVRRAAASATGLEG
jgi:hypothetical protein